MTAYNQKVETDLLFETSWEVCNKVGGIYTVLSTKAHTLQSLFKDKLIFIGPDVWSEANPCPVFTETKSLLRFWKHKNSLPYNIKVRVGRWEIPGRPIAVLVKFDSMYEHKDSLYAQMWDKFGVDSLHAYGDYDEACAFSHAAAIVIESIVADYKPGANIVALFNEWTTGMALLHVKATISSVATIFTTHATSIGRSICGNGKNLYQYFSGYNGDQMAAELNMQSKHSLEKAAAHNADCFTTVSSITAEECRQLLDRPVDIVTPNGFENNFVPAPSKYAKMRKDARKQILEVASKTLGRQLPDDTFIVATSGRCEYRNKGIDVFLDSINTLRTLSPSRPTLALVLVPAWVDKPTDDCPFMTHSVHNFDTDPIACHIRRIGHDFNEVSIVYVPCYLNGCDNSLNISYYDMLPAIDATVFPSYYEPWGYTPLESVAFGIPTITTSLSGFGRWILSDCQNGFTNSGVEVVERNDTNYADTVNHIAHLLKQLQQTTSKTLNEISKAAVDTAGKAAWQNFIVHYLKAFDIASARHSASAKN